MLALLRSTATTTLIGRSSLNVSRYSPKPLRAQRVFHLAHQTPSLYPTRSGCQHRSQCFSQHAPKTTVRIGPDHNTNSICSHSAHTGILSHIARFSNSSSRRIRKSYFPKPLPDGKPPNSDGFFSRLKFAINALPSGVVLWSVLGLNGIVYLFWNIGIDRAQHHQDASMLTFLVENFTLSWQNWKEGRFWTVLTSCFSNQATSHILMNALTFYWMAPPVLQILGNVSFLTLYLGGGIASSLVTLYCNELVLKQRRVVHGASGAIYAVISFMACTAPKATFLIFAVIPMPAWGCVAGLFTWDLVNALSERKTGVSEISHLSGIVSGILYFLHKTGRLPRFF